MYKSQEKIRNINLFFKLLKIFHRRESIEDIRKRDPLVYLPRRCWYIQGYLNEPKEIFTKFPHKCRQPRSSEFSEPDGTH